jgi:hypothetical protein
VRALRVALAGVVGVLGSASCVDLIPSPEIRHDIKDVKRKSDAVAWAGTYTFSECGAAAPGGAAAPCWTYVVAVDREADAVVTVDGPEAPPRIKATARVYKADELDIRFTSYADEGLDVSDVGIRAFEPFRGRLTPGQKVAQITRDASGRPCLNFDGLDSKLGTKLLCAAR